MAFNLTTRIKNAEERLAKFIDELGAKAKTETTADFKAARLADSEWRDGAERDLTGKVKKKLKPLLKSKS